MLGTEVDGSGITYDWNTGESSNEIEVTGEGVYELTVTNSIGCTFADTVQVIDFLLPSFDLGDDQFLCEGDTTFLTVAHLGPFYEWNTGDDGFALEVTEAGFYSVTVTDLNGCSNTDEVTIDYYPQMLVDLGPDESICVGESIDLNASVQGCLACIYQWNDKFTGAQRVVSPIADQVYSVTVTDGNGCTSSDMKTITVQDLPELSLSANAEICEGDSVDILFNINGIGPFDVVFESNGSINQLIDIEDGHFVRVSPNSTTTYQVSSLTDGSDLACVNPEIVEVTIIVNSNYEVLEQAAICEGDSLFLEGAFQFEPGIYVDSLLSQENCDSIIMTELIVNGMSEELIELTTCDENEVRHDSVFYANQFGCDSLVITRVDLLDSQFEEFFDTSCDITVATSDTLVFVNEFGCDSVIVNNVLPLPTDEFNLNETTCDENMAGLDTMFFTNQFGCDSLIITDFLYIPPDTIRDAEGSCFIENVGLDTVTLSNQYGCDSVIITNTTLLPSDTLVNNLITCVSDEVRSDTIFILNEFGCESLIITNFVLAFSDTMSVTMTDCNPANVGIDSTLYSNQFGCDSLVIITTLFLEPDTITTGAITCDPDHITVDTMTYVDLMGCDSVVITNYTYPVSYTHLTLPTICSV